MNILKQIQRRNWIKIFTSLFLVIIFNTKSYSQIKYPNTTIYISPEIQLFKNELKIKNEIITSHSLVNSDLNNIRESDDSVKILRDKYYYIFDSISRTLYQSNNNDTSQFLDKYKYDVQNREILYYQSKDHYFITNYYDKMIIIKCMSYGKLFNYRVFRYDRNGNLIKRSYFEKDSTLSETEHYFSNKIKLLLLSFVNKFTQKNINRIYTYYYQNKILNSITYTTYYNKGTQLKNVFIYDKDKLKATLSYQNDVLSELNTYTYVADKLNCNIRTDYSEAAMYLFYYSK